MAGLRGLGFVDPTKPKCIACGLSKQYTRMEVAGEGKQRILIVVESPSSAEDQTKKALMGKSYDYIRENLNRLGLSLEKDCWRISAMGCRKPRKKNNQLAYTDEEIRCCTPYLLGQVEKLKPKGILVFGSLGMQMLLASKGFTDCSVGRWHSLPIPYTTEKKHKCWLMSTFDPSLSVNSERKDDTYEPVIRKDISLFGKVVRKEVPSYSFPRVDCLYDKEDILNMLEAAKESDILSLDYETTGLKPDKEGHRIATCSLTFLRLELSQDIEVVSFPVDYMGAGGLSEEDAYEVKESLADLLDKHPFIIAHNAKFEQRWTQTTLGVDFDPNQTFCTMNVAHLIDERPKYCGLKFQAFMNFGVPDWSTSISKYLKSDDVSGNAFNRVDDAPLEDLLIYNGYDTYFTYLLYIKHCEYMEENDHLSKGILDIFLDGTCALGKAEAKGFHLVPGYYEENIKKISKEIKDLEHDLVNSREAAIFKKKRGKTFAFGDTKDLDFMIYDVIGVSLEKKTDSGQRSKDNEVLLATKNEWATKFIEHEKLEKARDTYFSQITREETEDVLRTTYNLHTTRTGRSSSTGPNWQNLPKRDKRVMKYVRSGIRAPLGQHFGEADYGQLEVRIAGCYTKDPVLMAYLADTSSDMHKDSALEIFDIRESEFKSLEKGDAKDIRFHAKNGFVFANFYGSSFKSCARTLWKVAPDLKMGERSVMDHLNYRGFRKYEEYEEHIKGVVEAFWKKFHVFKKWQIATIEFYNKNLYVENFFGYRRRGPLSRNEIINTAIQGTAFQTMLWSFNRLIELEEQQSWLSSIRGQIHDSILFSLHPNEKDTVLPIIRHVMEKETQKAFDWMCVPMIAEFELSPVNGTWVDLEGIEVPEMPSNYSAFTSNTHATMM